MRRLAADDDEADDLIMDVAAGGELDDVQSIRNRLPDLSGTR